MRLLSYFLRRAANATKSGPISYGYMPDGQETIFVRGKYSPAVQELINNEGIEEAWRFLKEDCGAAYGVVSDRLLR